MVEATHDWCHDFFETVGRLSSEVVSRFVLVSS
jgi:hypothetical protein